ncbi:MAG: hypothetical protein H6765_03815 [Candidatus Peribacteria bacterium]|nr:MAG: hypothetical protein H6765_03815 [Candidatus Peribacteria bacterium]
MPGQPSDWIYGGNKDTYKLDVDIAQGKSLIKDLVYEWYYQPYEISYEYGVDANWYYFQ